MDGRMKIQNLLEAEIKVPQSTYKEAMSVVCSDHFSRIVSFLLKDDDNFDLYLKIKPIIKQYQNKYGNFTVYEDYLDNDTLSRDLVFSMKEVEKRYFMKGQRKIGNRIIKIRVVYGDGPTGEYDPENKTITVESPNSQSIRYFANNSKYIPSLITKVEGVVHHELMHVVQHLVWNNLETEVAYRDEAGNIEYDKYHLDDIEYNPLIYSTFKDLKAQEDIIHQHLGRELSTQDRKDLFLSTVHPKAPDKFGLKRPLSGFYDTLYQKSPLQWKKAVKLLYGLYMKD